MCISWALRMDGSIGAFLCIVSILFSRYPTTLVQDACTVRSSSEKNTDPISAPPGALRVKYEIP